LCAARRNGTISIVPSSLLRFRSTAAIRTAIERGAPVVALESSVLAQGLLPPHNRSAATRMCEAISREGATPAITAIARGEPLLGLEGEDLERFLSRFGVRKVSARDLAFAMAQGADGATTVAGTLALSVLAGIEVFATGGIGGVHRGAQFDESADLVELARSSVLVVCAGAKSILDLPATLERLETLGVPVVGYRTRELPGFFCTSTGIALDSTAESVDEIAAAWRFHRELGRPGALLVVQPPPPEVALPGDLVEQAVAAALARAEREGIRHSAVTPFLLSEVSQRTGGRSVETNLALLESNATLAAQIAVAISKRPDPGRGRRVS
jgi:pseudouridylate synthase